MCDERRINQRVTKADVWFDDEWTGHACGHQRMTDGDFNSSPFDEEIQQKSAVGIASFRVAFNAYARAGR